MNLIDETLEPHGGVSKNNLDEIFHVDDEYINDEDFQIDTRFKMSPYYDHTNIKEYCNKNNETLNIMSFNSESKLFLSRNGHSVLHIFSSEAK